MTSNKKFLSFREASKFARSLKLRNELHWRLYCQKELRGYKRKPDDIPANPHRTYRDKGWKGYGDWLGTGNVASRYRQFRPFRAARTYVCALGLKSEMQWRRYCKGQLRGYKRKPDDIPANPHRTYRDKGWESYGNWLGTGNVASQHRKFRSFRSARAFARTLKLKNEMQWRRYYQDKLKGYKRKPDDIPANPHKTYRDKGWESYSDWLGTENIYSRYKKKPQTASGSSSRRKGDEEQNWQSYDKGLKAETAVSQSTKPSIFRKIRTKVATFTKASKK